MDNNFFKTVCDHTVDEIWVTDKDGVTLYVNSACKKIYGVKHTTDLIGKNVNELEALGYFKPSVASMVMKKEKQVTLEQKVRTGRLMLATGTPIFDETGTLQYIIQNSRDISGLHAMKIQVERTQKLMDDYKMQLEFLKKAQSSVRLIVYNSASMGSVMKLALRAAAFDISVLITGESGTGKNLIARYIHRNSSRSNKPFIQVNCPTIPESLAESELFGYRPGAFTGARKDGKPGLLEQANGGTLFLDEIGDLALSIQAKLLQVIEERRFIPVGGVKPVNLDIRLISATNQDIQKLISTNQFRSDLFYRLGSFNIEIPPLRHRKDDIPLLVSFFLQQIEKQMEGSPIHITSDVMMALKDHHWPGNVRELRSVIEYLVTMSEDSNIDLENLPKNVLEAFMTPSFERSPNLVSSICLKDLYDELGSTYKVAEVSGLSQSTVYRRLREHIKKVRERM